MVCTRCVHKDLRGNDILLMGQTYRNFITASDLFHYNKGAQRKFTSTLAILLLHTARKFIPPTNGQIWTGIYGERQCDDSHSVETYHKSHCWLKLHTCRFMTCYRALHFQWIALSASLKTLINTGLDLCTTALPCRCYYAYMSISS